MEKQEALRWFVDFANMDLDAIKPGDKAKLLVEAEEYLWPREELREYQRMTPVPLSKERMKRLKWALEMPLRDSPKYWAAIVQSQKAVHNLFMGLQITGHPAPGVVDSGPMVVQVSRGHDDAVVLWWMVKGYKVPYAVKLLPVAKSQKDYLSLKIALLLDSLPQHAIRVCPGCKRFFFNPTRRKKEFCSPKCMWRVIAGKRRRELKEKHPKKYKAYLKKQKEIMSKKFQEKQKAKGFKKVAPYKYTRIVKEKGE